MTVSGNSIWGVQINASVSVSCLPINTWRVDLPIEGHSSPTLCQVLLFHGVLILMVLSKAKRQYLLTLQVNIYCLLSLPLQSRIVYCTRDLDAVLSVIMVCYVKPLTLAHPTKIFYKQILTIGSMEGGLIQHYFHQVTIQKGFRWRLCVSQNWFSCRLFQMSVRGQQNAFNI